MYGYEQERQQRKRCRDYEGITIKRKMSFPTALEGQNGRLIGLRSQE